MNINNLTAAILALTIGISHGHLFDTEEQLNKRYGEPVTTEDSDSRYSKRQYKWSNYDIEAWLFYRMEEGSRFEYLNGTVVYQRISRSDKMSIDSREVGKFLKEGGYKYEWRGDGVDRWRIGPNTTAQYDRMDRTLIMRFGKHGQ